MARGVLPVKIYPNNACGPMWNERRLNPTAQHAELEVDRDQQSMRYSEFKTSTCISTLGRCTCCLAATFGCSKGKTVPQHTYGGTGRERRYSSYSIKTSALDVGESSV
jgi:hypothetical protein